MGTVFLKLSMWQLQARSPLLKTGMKCMGTLNSYNEHFHCLYYLYIDTYAYLHFGHC